MPHNSDKYVYLLYGSYKLPLSKQIYRDESSRWCAGMSQVPEDSDDDAEAGYISSDESAHAADLGERLRVKPSKDVWELGKT